MEWLPCLVRCGFVIIDGGSAGVADDPGIGEKVICRNDDGLDTPVQDRAAAGTIVAVDRDFVGRAKCGVESGTTEGVEAIVIIARYLRQRIHGVSDVNAKGCVEAAALRVE